MNDSTKFAGQVILTFVIGVLAAVVATYIASIIASSFGWYDRYQWPETGNFISGITFGLVVGYRFSTLNTRSRKQKK